MVPCKRLAGTADVQSILRPRPPRKVKNPVEIGAAHRVLGRRLVHLFEAAVFLLSDFPRLIGKLCFIKPFPQVAKLDIAIPLPKFLLDRP